MCYVARQQAVRLPRSLHVLALLLVQRARHRVLIPTTAHQEEDKQAQRRMVVVVDGDHDDHDDRERPAHRLRPVLVEAWMPAHNIGRVLKLGSTVVQSELLYACCLARWGEPGHIGGVGQATPGTALDIIGHGRLGSRGSREKEGGLQSRILSRQLAGPASRVLGTLECVSVVGLFVRCRYHRTGAMRISAAT